MFPAITDKSKQIRANHGKSEAIRNCRKVQRNVKQQGRHWHIRRSRFKFSSHFSQCMILSASVLNSQNSVVTCWQYWLCKIILVGRLKVWQPLQKVFDGRWLAWHSYLRFYWKMRLIVSVLWQEEGFPLGISLCSGYILLYIPTQVTIQTFSMTTPALTFLGDQYWKSWFSVLPRLLGNTGKYYPVD